MCSPRVGVHKNILWSQPNPPFLPKVSTSHPQSSTHPLSHQQPLSVTPLPTLCTHTPTLLQPTILLPSPALFQQEFALFPVNAALAVNSCCFLGSQTRPHLTPHQTQLPFISQHQNNKPAADDLPHELWTGTLMDKIPFYY